MKITNLGLFLILFAAFLLQPGCNLVRAFVPTEIVKHPDAPMQILEAKTNYLRVAVYDREDNQMIEFGWIETSSLKGWTLTKYDWEAVIIREKDRRNP